MVGAIHDELDASGYGAEFPDDQFVADEIVEVCDMLLELIGTVYIIIVRVIPDDDPRILHHILDVAEAGNLRIWECYIRIGPFGYLVHIDKGNKYRPISQCFPYPPEYQIDTPLENHQNWFDNCPIARTGPRFGPVRALKVD
jgi:hypothetical protein